MNFDYKSVGNHVYFGAGKISILTTLLVPFERVMIVAGKSGNKAVAELISVFGEAKVAHFDKVIQHVPEELANEGLMFFRKHSADIIVAIGGGSAIGLAKAVALETRLPIFAVPSTYAGSEQTDIWGITKGNNKITGHAEHVVPRVVIYDPNLTVTMPKALAVTSAMNAFAHLMEATYSTSGNPITSHTALLGMKVLKQGLEDFITQTKLSMDVNAKLLFGAYLGGKCLSEVSMSLHHKAAHVLGGSFNLDHASIHTVLLPYVLAYQWPYLTNDIRAAFVDSLGSPNPPLALRTLTSNLGAQTDLKSLGFRNADIEQAASLIVSNSFSSPAPVIKEGVTTLLESAFDGILPQLQ